MKEQKGWFTIGAISNQADVNWATARAYLLQLLAKGLIEGEELPIRGWIFRSKVSEPTEKPLEVKGSMIFRAKKTPVEASIALEGST